MTRIRNAAFAAIAAACLVAPAVAQEREAVHASVRYADLDLATASGRAALKTRIRNVVAATCPEMTGTLEQKADSMRCRHEMMKDGEMQIARLVGPSDPQLALAGRR